MSRPGTQTDARLPEPGGGDVFARALRWSFLWTWGVSGGSALTMLVLASLLGPDAFGLVALASVYVLLLQLLLDPGISQALIQRPDLEQRHLDSAFWFVAGMGVVLFAFSIALSRWWAQGSEEPDLPLIIGWLSLRVPLVGLTIVQQAVLRRTMDFRPLALRANVGVVAGAIVGVGMALTGWGYWSLVGQQLVEAAVGLVLLWRMSSWRPRFAFQPRALRELSGFSAASFLANVGVFAYMRGDAVVMGYFFGPAAVGIYRLALRLMNLCSDIGTQAVNQASLPEMSRHQHDPPRLREATLVCLHTAATITLSLLGVLAAISGDLFPLMGEHWKPARLPLLVLCVLGLFQVVSIISTPMLQAVGRPGLNAVLAWIWGGLTLGVVVAIGVVTRSAPSTTQILAVCVAHVAFGALLHFPVYAFLMRQTCGIRLRDIAATIGPGAIAALLAFLATQALRGWTPLATAPPFVALLVSGATASLAIAAVLLTFDRRSRVLVRPVVARLYSGA